jgi:hypothetical protein
MPTTETTYDVTVSPPSSLRTGLNIVAAAVAVVICVVILTLLATTPSRLSARHAPAHGAAPITTLRTGQPGS